MSGGSYDYLGHKVVDAVSQVARLPGTEFWSKEEQRAVRVEYEVLRLAFAQHLKLVGEALNAIEWHDDGDWGPAKALEAMRAVFAGAPAGILPAALADAEASRARLDAAIVLAGGASVPPSWVKGDRK